MQKANTIYRPSGTLDSTTGGTVPQTASLGIRGIPYTTGYLVAGALLMGLFPWVLG